MFDWRGRYVWALVLGALLLQQLLFAWLGLHITGSEPWRSIVIGLPLMLLAGTLRRRGNGTLAAMIETIVLLRIAGLTFFLLQFPMLVIGGPLADPLLLRADDLFGFDWTSFARWFANPKIDLFLATAYATFRTQGVLVLAFLCATGQVNRAWQMLTAALGSLLVVILLLSIFAADGSFVGCGLRPEGLPHHADSCRYALIIHGFKSGAFRTIDDPMYFGLGSFPSFHVAGALILVWAVWHSHAVRWVWLALNLSLGIGSVVIANHYFVDVIGGLALGAAAIMITKRLLPGCPGTSSSPSLAFSSGP